jgi:hypothetical protein
MGHYLMNSMHIDKLIAIKGLPEDWFFRQRADGQKELLPPWKPDIDANIPREIRHICEPTEIVQYFPPIEKGKEGIVDKMTILGVRLDYMTEPGREMWTRVERYMDSSLPRDVKLPEPVLVARDQKSGFETFSPRKRVTGGVELTPAEVPVVDLNKKFSEPSVEVVKVVAAVASPPVSQTPILKCDQCDYTHEKKQAIRMHTLKRHPQKEKAGITT